MFESIQGGQRPYKDAYEDESCLLKDALFFHEDDFNDMLDEENDGHSDEQHLKMLRKATQFASLENQLEYVTSVKYREQTINGHVLKFLTYLQETNHEGFYEDGWSANAVYEKWLNLVEYREALLVRFCGGDDNSYPIYYHAIAKCF